MTQPTIKIDQLDATELNVAIDTRLSVGTSLEILSDTVIGSPIPVNQSLIYTGSPIAWRPTLKTVGGGLTYGAGSPNVLDVDTTVARTNATNTFTTAVSGISGGGVVLTNNAPGYILDDTSAAVDESIWRMFSSSGVLTFDARNDANTVSSNWLAVNRTGTVVDDITLTAGKVAIVSTGSPQATTVLDIDGNVEGSYTGIITNANTGDSSARFVVQAGDTSCAWFTAGSGKTTPILTNGPIGEQTVIRNLGLDPLVLGTGNTERIRITGAGAVWFPGISTTASAANAFLDSTFGSPPANSLLRSTSSEVYKHDITDISNENLQKVFDLQPIEYRSLAEADDPDQIYYGLTAEQVYEIEPRLVQLRGGVPDGVMYDRVGVLLLGVVKDLANTIKELKEQIEQLENK